LKQHTL